MKHLPALGRRALLAVLFVGTAVALAAQQLERSAVQTYRVAPGVQPFDDSLLSALRVPSGFRVAVFARGLVDPRMMEAAPDGTVYLTRWKSGDVLALRDTNADGVVDQQTTVLRLDGAHGIDLRGDVLYVASPTEIWTVGVAAGQPTTAPARIVAGLPDGGQHPSRTIQFGPDGLLYVSVGSSCNDCAESNQLERGTFIRYTAAGERRDILAKGLRNSIGFDWHPETGELWAMDNGNDMHGDDIPPEELNRIQAGKHYGWPNCYAAQQVDAHTNARPEQQALRPGEGKPSGTRMTRQEFCAQTEPSVLNYPAHAAPIGMQFYEGSQFPSYRGDAFVALRGSWNRRQPVGYRVVRVRYDGGVPGAFEDFLSGFLTNGGASYFGRPAGLAVAPDGSLLVSEDGNGVIYRVSSNR